MRKAISLLILGLFLVGCNPVVPVKDDRIFMANYDQIIGGPETNRTLSFLITDNFDQEIDFEVFHNSVSVGRGVVQNNTEFNLTVYFDPELTYREIAICAWDDYNPVVCLNQTIALDSLQPNIMYLEIR